MTNDTWAARTARAARTLTNATLILALALGVAGSASAHQIDPNAAAAAEFERVRQSPVELRMFLQRFPKGGDLHSHLSGAVHAEDYIDWAVAGGLCLSLQTMTASEPPCAPEADRPALAAAISDGSVDRNAIVDAWSLRNFAPGISAPSGHDQFFGSFARFDAVSNARKGDMLAATVENASEQNVLYVELMMSPQMWRARSLAGQLDPDGSFEEHYEALMAAGIEDLVALASAEITEIVEISRQRLGCPDSGHRACTVEVRFLAQVIRTFQPHQVFAQSLLAFLLSEADARVVGLNLVAPEDDPVTLATYATQMRQLGWLADRRGPVPVTLHAGELALGLVPPRHLRDHIRQAVEVAGARRIGHGVAIAYERDAERLLMAMARKGVMVEINLSSNAQILGVEGSAHPFETYRKYDVPMALSTDDEGVSRIDLTHEYQRAVETYGLGYADLKALSRNALTHAFLPGRSLWPEAAAGLPAAACSDAALGAPDPPSSCEKFLAASGKARLQWRLEAAFRSFEADLAVLRRERGF